MSKLNTLQFTVHTEDQVFKNKLLAFINTHKLINTSAEANDYTYKLNLVDDFLVMYGRGSAAKFANILRNEGIVFFYLHIDGNDYSFSFENITELYKFYKYNEIIGDIESAYLATDYMFSEYSLIQRRAKIIENFMSFLRKEGLLATSTIDAISFVSMILSTDDANILKQFIKYGELLKDELKKNMYSGTVDYYKAYIKQPQEIMDIYRMKRCEDKIDIHTQDEDKILKMLKEAVKHAFGKIKKLEIKKDTRGYYIHADESCLKVWNKPVKIFDNISVEFKPVLIGLQNFYGIVNPMKQECVVKLYNSKKIVEEKVYNSLEKIEQAGIDDEYSVNAVHYQKVYEIEMRSKERHIFVLEINDWKITDEKLLQSHKEQVYTLGDDIEDLLMHIDKIPKFPNITQKISSDEIKGCLKSLLS